MFPLELGVSLVGLEGFVADSRGDEAVVEIGRESVAVLREAAKAEGRSRIDLSRALHKYGRWLANSGDLEPGLEALREAVAIRTELVAEGVTVHEHLVFSH